MATHMLRLDIMMDLEDILAPENIQGASIALAGRNLDENEIVGAFGDFVSLLVSKGLSDRKNLNLYNSEVFLVNKQEINSEESLPESHGGNYDWSLDEENDSKDEQSGNYLIDEAEQFDESIIDNPLIKAICTKAFQIVSEAGTIETVLYNDDSVKPEQISLALTHLVGIEREVGVKIDKELNHSEFSIGFDIFGSKEVAISKISKEEGE